MTVRLTSRSQRWPRFNDLVLYNSRQYRIVATQVSPAHNRGFILRREDASDASADVLLPFSAWQGYRWNAAAKQWEQVT